MRGAGSRADKTSSSGADRSSSKASGFYPNAAQARLWSRARRMMLSISNWLLTCTSCCIAPHCRSQPCCRSLFPCSGVVVPCAPWLSAGSAASATLWGRTVSVTRVPNSEGCNFLFKGGRSLCGIQRQQLHFSKVWRTRWIPRPAVTGARSDAKTTAAGTGAVAHLHTRARASRQTPFPWQEYRRQGQRGGDGRRSGTRGGRSCGGRSRGNHARPQTVSDFPRVAFTKHASRGCHYGRPRLHRIEFLVCRMLMTSEPLCEELKKGSAVHACCRLPAPLPHRGRRVGEAANPGPAEDQDNVPFNVVTARCEHSRKCASCSQPTWTSGRASPTSGVVSIPDTLSEHMPLATPRSDSDGVVPTWLDVNNDLAPPAPHALTIVHDRSRYADRT